MNLTSGILIKTAKHVSRHLTVPNLNLYSEIEGIDPKFQIHPLLNLCKLSDISLFQDKSVIEIYRSIIFAYITNNQTYTWLPGAWRGKKFIFDRLSDDLKSCLFQADLLETIEPTSSNWWDQLILHCRYLSDQGTNIIGDKGHDLSYDYEFKRVYKYPVRTYIENTEAGYDLTSKESHNSEKKLLIEVKASEKPLDHAYANISFNEWKVASDHDNYIFHFWSLADANNPTIAVLSRDMVIEEKPSNLGLGEWTSYRIQFSKFLNHFK
ncbi:DUF3883 domain-containing protein [Gammaproteobacteria bacterium]|nr:DUF3883 domain-containing protein [Gammaproteobacteria bacterium]